MKLRYECTYYSYFNAYPPVYSLAISILVVVGGIELVQFGVADIAEWSFSGYCVPAGPIEHSMRCNRLLQNHQAAN